MELTTLMLRKMEVELDSAKDKRRKNLETELNDFRMGVIQSIKEEAEIQKQKIKTKRKERMTALDNEMAILKTKLEQRVDNEINSIRGQRISKMDEEMLIRKEKALNDVLKWNNKQKKKMEQRFEKQYKSSVESIRKDFENIIHNELENIREHFLSLAKEKKALVEEDISRFLDQKFSGISKIHLH